jgi:hypothetical protein
MTRTRSEWVRSVRARLLLVGLLGGAGLVGGKLAIAQHGNETAWEEAEEAAPPPVPHDTFTQFPAGEGAIAFEELSAAEKQAVMNADEWAETRNGHEVHQAWSRYTQARRDEARLKRAANRSGTAGLELVGVE